MYSHMLIDILGPRLYVKETYEEILQSAYSASIFRKFILLLFTFFAPNSIVILDGVDLIHWLM